MIAQRRPARMMAIDPQVARAARRLGVQHGLRASEIYLALRDAAVKSSLQDAVALAEYVCEQASTLRCSFREALLWMADRTEAANG